MSERVYDHFPRVLDFEELLEEAEDQASGEWAEQFCKDIRAKYKQYKGSLFLSDKQLKHLKLIAEGDDGHTSDTFERFERGR